MPTWIALFRGINVGGRHVLPMKDLVKLLEGLGHQHVRTYIQSGNAVFTSHRRSPTSLGREIEQRIEEARGFRPRVLVLSRKQLRTAIEANPFPEAEAEPKTLHLSFAASPPTCPDLASLEQACTPREAVRLIGEVLYFHAPDGIGRSRAAAAVEKALGVEATARNWRTVRAIERLATASHAKPTPHE